MLVVDKAFTQDVHTRRSHKTFTTVFQASSVSKAIQEYRWQSKIQKYDSFRFA